MAEEKAVKKSTKKVPAKKKVKKIKSYKGAEQPHQAQQPVELKIKGVRD